MKVRLSDVAALAGVHPATVSRALNEQTRHRLSDATVEKVLDAANALNYSPDVMAQGLAQGRSSSIGVLVGDITVPLFPPILRGIDDVTSQAGYSALFLNTDNDAGREKDRIRAVKARSVEGLIVATAAGDGPDAQYYSEVAPAVFVVRTPVGSSVTSVVSDDAAGIHSLVAHLVDLGHRRIAHIAGPQNVSTAVTRLRAYREALFEHGLEYDPRLVVEVSQLRSDDGTTAFNELLARDPGFTAVVAFNDLLALGIYRSLRDHGMACPADMSVTGFNDMQSADLVAPPLTTVAVNYHEMGRQAAQLLMEKIQQGDSYTPRSVRLPVVPVFRGSTGPCPETSGHVAQRDPDRAHS